MWSRSFKEPKHLAEVGDVIKFPLWLLAPAKGQHKDFIAQNFYHHETIIFKQNIMF
jgi:hypothetical protein